MGNKFSNTHVIAYLPKQDDELGTQQNDLSSLTKWFLNAMQIIGVVKDAYPTENDHIADHCLHRTVGSVKIF